jgi:hypothetical protein
MTTPVLLRVRFRPAGRHRKKRKAHVGMSRVTDGAEERPGSTGIATLDNGLLSKLRCDHGKHRWMPARSHWKSNVPR